MIYGGRFELDKSVDDINKLESIMQESNFWDDKNTSEEVINRLNSLRKKFNSVNSLKTNIQDSLDILELLKLETDDNLLNQVTNDKDSIGKQLEALEITLLLNGPYDQNSAILDVHSGAGGTEACDWAEMLLRMYLRWCEKNDYKTETVDIQYSEAGIKSATVLIKGEYAYGYLRNEKGVHRLIRISPFDANSRRHTSFASIDIMPMFDNKTVDVEIKDTDLRIDVYRSSGKGGQGVNTTDSAVRITHLPTKLVVTVQNERSQIQNKEKAMEILRNRLYKLELEKRDRELNDIKGEQSDINFGSQIRSYIMHPYSLVKDHRTNTEETNVVKVLDGDIDAFIDDNLKNSR